MHVVHSPTVVLKLTVSLTVGLVVRAGALPLFEGRSERGLGDPVLHRVGVQT